LVPDISNHHSGLILKGQIVSLDIVILADETTTLSQYGTSYPLMQCHIPEW